MKIKDGFILRKVSDVNVVVAVGEAAANFNGMITLNGTGALLWEILEKGCNSKETLVAALLEEYEVTVEQASRDVDVFVKKVADAGILED